jgi:hypothetical protein
LFCLFVATFHLAADADQTLHDLLEDMERLARERKAVTKPAA